MRYRVTGIDRASAKPMDLVLDAGSPDAAAQAAATRGLDVAAVTPADPSRPPEPVNVRLAPGETMLIERTAKPIKAWIAAGMLAMFAGFALAAADLIINFAHPDRIGALLRPGLVLAGLGLLVLLAARLSAWWRHG